MIDFETEIQHLIELNRNSPSSFGRGQFSAFEKALEIYKNSKIKQSSENNSTKNLNSNHKQTILVSSSNIFRRFKLTPMVEINLFLSNNSCKYASECLDIVTVNGVSERIINAWSVNGSGCYVDFDLVAGKYYLCFNVPTTLKTGDRIDVTFKF